MTEPRIIDIVWMDGTAEVVTPSLADIAAASLEDPPISPANPPAFMLFVSWHACRREAIRNADREGWLEWGAQVASARTRKAAGDPPDPT